jgi:hypothetical protein
LKKEKEHCNFSTISTEDLSDNKLKVSFRIRTKENINKNSSFIEKSTNVEKATGTDDCDPSCVNGVCQDTICYCRIGWMGINCSIGK